jgi:hypothetical protein
MTKEPLRITIKDLRASGICVDARLWFQRHDLDWKDFVRNGIDAEILLATKDAQGVRVVEEARGRR